jgi:protease IV
MKSFFKYVLASLTAIVLFLFLGFIFLLIAGVSGGSGNKAYIAKNSVLTFNVSDKIAEQSKDAGVNFAGLGGSAKSTIGLYDLQYALQKAKTDDKIKGIYLKLGMSVNSWATLYDLRAALKDFKTSKKFIYAYGDIADQKSLYLSSLADTTFINPSGGMEWKGISATGAFFKRALDKWGVKPEVFYCGKFKGASEPYRLEKFSEPNRAQINDLINDFYSELLVAVSEKSKKDINFLKKLANEFAIRQPYDGVENGFIEGAKYEKDMLTSLRLKLGIKDLKTKIKFSSFGDYTNNCGGNPGLGSSKNKIAVLYAEGEIVDGEAQDDKICSKPMMREIRRIANDDKIKALVLRVNSPGGSALASENIYQELMELKKKKPIVVSMGDVAASGGYYIACAADSIFAQRTTITGSIGVVGAMLNFEDFLNNKVGVTTDVVKTSQFADLPNVARALTDGERKIIQEGVDTIYAQFKNRVVIARKLSSAFIDSVAEGHVYSGVRAKKIGLVDDLAGMDRAIMAVAKLAKLDKYELAYYPLVKDPVQAFMEQFNPKKNNDVILQKALGADYATYQQLQAMRQNMNKVMAVWPYQLDIK